jgi:hypothetical protein
MNPTISYQLEQARLPRTNLGLLRRALLDLPLSNYAQPASPCLRFRGCARLLYTAARQRKLRITVRKQSDGSCLVWKLPPEQPAPTTNARPGVLSSGNAGRERG